MGEGNGVGNPLKNKRAGWVVDMESESERYVVHGVEAVVCGCSERDRKSVV